MAKTSLTYSPSKAIHPGVSLKDELEFLNLSQTELAKRTGMSEKHIRQIINGESPVTPETAIKFERAIKTPANFWNTLQKSYDDVN
ncbi:MAG: HigA family addiction module antitoxin [Thermoplasmata archaeon]